MSPFTWSKSTNSQLTTSRFLDLQIRCGNFRCANSWCISYLFQHVYRSPNLHRPLQGPVQLWFMWCKSIRHITTAKNTEHQWSATVTGITHYDYQMVICWYIPACNVQIIGFASLMLLLNSLLLSPSTHNCCSIHSRQLQFYTSLISWSHNFIVGERLPWTNSRICYLTYLLQTAEPSTAQKSDICTIAFIVWPLNSNVAADGQSSFCFKCPSLHLSRMFSLSTNISYI